MAGFTLSYSAIASCPKCTHEFTLLAVAPMEYIMCEKCYCTFDKDGNVKFTLISD